jgi:hypothetical protein
MNTVDKIKHKIKINNKIKIINKLIVRKRHFRILKKEILALEEELENL